MPNSKKILEITKRIAEEIEKGKTEEVGNLIDDLVQIRESELFQKVAAGGSYLDDERKNKYFPGDRKWSE